MGKAINWRSALALMLRIGTDLSRSKIGDHLGVGSERARQLEMKARRNLYDLSNLVVWGVRRPRAWPVHRLPWPPSPLSPLAQRLRAFDPIPLAGDLEDDFDSANVRRERRRKALVAANGKG